MHPGNGVAQVPEVDLHPHRISPLSGHIHAAHRELLGFVAVSYQNYIPDRNYLKECIDSFM
jgi:hypothetical protein